MQVGVWMGGWVDYSENKALSGPLEPSVAKSEHMNLFVNSGKLHDIFGPFRGNMMISL